MSAGLEKQVRAQLEVAVLKHSDQLRGVRVSLLLCLSACLLVFLLCMYSECAVYVRAVYVQVTRPACVRVYSQYLLLHCVQNTPW